MMLTDRTEEIDWIVGLEVGADDHLTKPFASRADRPGAGDAAPPRHHVASTPSDVPLPQRFGDLTIDLERHGGRVTAALISTLPRSTGPCSGSRTNLVAPLRLSGGKLHDEYRQHGEHHHHLICEHCGAYLPIADADLATLKAALYEGCGFRLDMNHLVLR